MNRLLVVALCLLWTSSTALAQESSAVTTETAPAAERALPFARVGLGYGAFAFFKAPATTNRLTVGQSVRFELQFDFFERLSASLQLMGASHRMGPLYEGFSGGAAHGDFVSLTPAAAVRLNVLGFGETPFDGRRFWVYVKAGGGYMLFWPKSLIPEGDALFFGGLGFEYRTHLRHFTLGLEATPTYSVRNQSLGLAILPNIQFAL